MGGPVYRRTKVTASIEMSRCNHFKPVQKSGRGDVEKDDSIRRGATTLPGSYSRASFLHENGPPDDHLHTRRTLHFDCFRCDHDFHHETHTSHRNSLSGHGRAAVQQHLAFECKYELDSPAAFLPRSLGYYGMAADSAFFGRVNWLSAAEAAMAVAETMRNSPTYAANGSVVLSR